VRAVPLGEADGLDHRMIGHEILPESLTCRPASSTCRTVSNYLPAVK